MNRNKCFWCKQITFCISGIATSTLFFISLYFDYQLLAITEHIRFRPGFPSQVNWISSPYGRLNCYLFSVTNSESFLNGTDNKLKIEEIGPIVYKIKGRNEILKQNDSNLIYQKMRYHEIDFDAEASYSPDILNKRIVMPNFFVLGAAAKFHDWVFLVRHAFNAITINAPVFLNETVNYFLWEFKAPALDVLSNYVPNIVANCGMLYNALRKRSEIYDVNIGTERGLEKFFSVNSLNNRTIFPEHLEKTKFSKIDNSNAFCPIEVKNAFDNSLFTPFIKKEDLITIVAGEACSTHKLKYKDTVEHLGFSAYRFKVADELERSNCLDRAMGIPLHKGMFDVSKCLFNDIPSAFSYPHFYGTTYDWSEHFEGFTPNEEKHSAYIIVEPTTGIPIEEKYRFQSNIVMPKMDGYNKNLQRFNNMVLPTFWYEYDLDDLPLLVILLMRINIYILPVLQPILIGVFLFFSSYCFLKMHLLCAGISLRIFFINFKKYVKTRKTLKTTFDSNEVFADK